MEEERPSDYKAACGSGACGLPGALERCSDLDERCDLFELWFQLATRDLDVIGSLRSQPVAVRKTEEATEIVDDLDILGTPLPPI